MTIALAAFSAGASAQLIDLDLINKSASQVTEPNYTGWAVPTSKDAASITLENGMKITVDKGPNSTADAIQSNWWKDGMNKYSKLTSDGITPKVMLEDGNRVEPTGRVELNFTIEGMTPGEHTLKAFHNNVDGGTIVSPALNVSVNGEVQQTGIKQTQRGTKPSEVAMSFVKFTVKEGEPVVIQYFTEPEAGKEYTTTSFYVNCLEFDVNPYEALDPTPDNYDYHADADNGILLSWKPAEVAAKHRIVLCNDSAEAANSKTYIYEGTAAQYKYASKLSPLKKYFWRVDEIAADGTVYKGRVWTFQPRRLAFPDAEGYGRFAIGGRGGVVYHVTSLDDDAENPQPGTFRYGITKVTGPRTIVFDVAGVIELKARLMCSDKFVTIAGQTAPGRGIMFKGSPFGMQSDGITRFIRMRVGGADDWDGVSANENTSDGMGMSGNDHSIMDHCTIGWTIDEAFSSRNAKNVTLQRTMLAETLNQAGHKNYDNRTNHGYAATIGGDCGSYHHNLLAHNEGRNWSLSGGLDGAGAYAGAHDVFNNVVYNWGGRATDGGTHECNFVNNYYKMGPSTTRKVLLQADLEGTGSGTQSYYVAGNIRENVNGTKTTDKEGETYNYRLTNDQVLDWTVFVNKPFFESYAVIETAEAAYMNTLSDVGCNMPESDNNELRIINETLTKTTSKVGNRTNKKGIIDRESDSEGFEGLNIVTMYRPSGFDQDGDGIADWFEDAAGWSKTTANNNDDSDNDGYTDLEEYLEWLAEPNFIVKAGEAKTIGLKPYFAGYTDFDVVLPENTNEVSEDGSGNLTFTSTATGLKQVEIKVICAKTGNSYARNFNFCVTDNLPATETTDGIEELEDSHSAAAPVYTITGVKVSKAGKGIYIQNGRKFIVK